MQSSLSDKKNSTAKIQEEPPQTTLAQIKDDRLTRKEKIDLFFRTVSLLAIGMPVVMFLFQQNASVKQQRELAQLDTYATTTRELNALLRRPAGSVEFNQAKDKLEYDLLPKIEYLFGADITGVLDNMNRSVLVYTDVAKTGSLFEKILELENNFGSSLCSFQNEKSIAPDDREEQQNNYQLLDSLVADYIEQDSKMQQWNQQSLEGDTDLQRLLPAFADMVKNQTAFHLAFQSDCNEIVTVFHQEGGNKGLTNVYEDLKVKKDQVQQTRTQLRESLQALSGKLKEHMNADITRVKAKMKTGNNLFQ